MLWWDLGPCEKLPTASSKGSNWRWSCTIRLCGGVMMPPGPTTFDDRHERVGCNYKLSGFNNWRQLVSKICNRSLFARRSSIDYRAHVINQHAHMAIRTPRQTCANQDAWVGITSMRPKANSIHTATLHKWTRTPVGKFQYHTVRKFALPIIFGYNEIKSHSKKICRWCVDAIHLQKRKGHTHISQTRFQKWCS